MITGQYILDVHHELIIDNFSGGGGASTGIELALGRHVDIAINHDPEAVAMHSANHPQTRHYCESVWEIDPLEVTQGRPVGLVWLSPDCKHFSKAKGGTPVKKEIRGLAWVKVRWAMLVRPRVMMLENVEEFVTWGPVLEGEEGVFRPCPDRRGQTFDGFVAMLTTGIAADHPAFLEACDFLGLDPAGAMAQRLLNGLGYTVECRELRACDYDAPTIRKRLFMICRRDGKPIVWPEPTHADPKSKAVKTKKLKPWRTAAECIDWSIPCPSIFDRKKPLAEATCRRIAKGIMRYVVHAADPFIVGVGGRMGQSRPRSVFEPVQTLTGKADSAIVMPTIVPVTHQGGDRVEPITEPMRTVTGAHRGEKALATAYLTPYYSDKRANDARGMLPDEPIKTVTTENRHALVTAFLAKHYGGVVGSDLCNSIGTVTSVDHHSLVTAHIQRDFGASVGHAADDPLATVTPGGGGKAAIVTSHIAKLRGENVGHADDEPLHTISAGGTHHAEVRAFLIKYYGTDQDPRLTEPLHTITTKDRYGLVTIAGEQYAITDIGLRMLSPRELYRAQGFPENYIIGDKPEQGLSLTKSAQVRMCGNSVCPPIAAALVRANMAEIAIRRVA